jgi:integrase
LGSAAKNPKIAVHTAERKGGGCMSQPNSVPKYRLHKKSGQAVVSLPDGRGYRKDFYLGPFNSPESKAEYERVLAEWLANGRKIPGKVTGPGMTVNELIAEYWEFAERYYRKPDGSPSSELRDFKNTLRPFKHLYGPTPACEFGPLALKAVRELMIKGYVHPDYGPQKALSRGVVNQRIGRIKRVFKWAVENEKIPSSVHHGLEAVRGLAPRRSEARETEPVKPVPLPFVRATQEKAGPVVADMIELQLLTGMRPGELVIMRACDIDMAGPVWIYTPTTHKTLHLGHTRPIQIGPQGQEVIRRYLKPNTQAFLFSPRESMEIIWEEQRANRKTKVQPSQRNRKKPNPKKKLGEKYTTASYGHAIVRAAEKAGVPAWHPHQLRHTRATEIRRHYGIDAARAVLGHHSPAITEVYAELDESQAAKIMREIG